MPTNSERAEMITKIKRLPEQLEAALSGLHDSQLDTPYGPGKWTVRQVAHHLCDSHMNAFLRFKFVLLEETPAIRAYNQDDWATTVDSARAPVSQALALLRGLHARWGMLLDSLVENQWSRSGQHSERGNITVDDLLVIYSVHGETHVAQIAALRSARGW